jgi:hypothetical protein
MASTTRTTQPSGSGARRLEPVTHRPGGDGTAEVVHALLLLQTAVALVATTGMVGLMAGNLLYAVVPVMVVATLLGLSRAILRGRRWAVVTVLVGECLSLVKVMFNLVIAALAPELAMTVNPVSFVTMVALPAGVAVLCLQLLRRP